MNRQRVELRWYDRETHYIGTTRAQAGRHVDLAAEQSRIEAVYPDAAYVQVVVSVEAADDHTVTL
jgi:hypothetical protein